MRLVHQEADEGPDGQGGAERSAAKDEEDCVVLGFEVPSTVGFW